MAYINGKKLLFNVKVQGATKEYVDAGDAKKVDKTTGKNMIYGTDNNGKPYLYTQTSAAATRYTIAMRDTDGCIKTGTPKSGEDAANRDYVDNLVQAPTENGVFTSSVTIGDPDANTTGGINTVIADTSINMWSRAGGERLIITLDNDPEVSYSNHGQSKHGSAKFEDIVNVANAYANASFYLAPFTVDNLKADTIEVQDALILKSPNGTKYKITVADDGTLSATAVTA